MATSTEETKLCYVRISDIPKKTQKMLMPISGYGKMKVASLEEAVLPLVSILPKIQNYVYIAKARCEPVPADGLSKDESASIILYSMDWEPHKECLYIVLNEALHAEDRIKLKPWFSYLNLILGALFRLPSSQRAIYRGVKMDLSKEYSKGKKFIWWGFSSCASCVEVLENNQFLGKTGPRTLFTIDCFSGKDITRHSYSRSENEHLLLPAREFQVIDSIELVSGLHVIQLNEIKSSITLLEQVIIDSETNKLSSGLPIETSLPKKVEEGNLFDKFENELKLLWTQYNVDDELDFNSVAQQLFDENMKVLEEIKDYMLDEDFTRFKLELMKSEQFKEIWTAKKLSKSNSTDHNFTEFKAEMIKLFESEDLRPKNVVLESLVQQLYENEDNNIADFFKNIIIPKKIKRLIIKIQSNEKLKIVWKSNMLIFGNMKRILEEHIEFTGGNDDIYIIISELYVNSENGMKLIEGKCTPEKFKKIKSNFYNDAEIRSRVFHEKNAITPENIDDTNERLSSSSIKMTSINESDQDKKLETIRCLQKIMLGRDYMYPDQFFTEIFPLNYSNLKGIIEEHENGNSTKSLLDVILPYILNKLKTGIDLSEICELEIFWDETSQLYGIDYKTIFVCMIERYQHHQLTVISLIKKLGIALPFAYQWVVQDKLILKIPLRAYSHCLAIDCPIVISLGSGSIGKSTLLNKIYSAKFITNKAGIINNGIDVLFSTPEFSCGFTIFDIHGDACKQEYFLKVFFKMMPLENCWILLQSISVDETKAIIKILKLFGINNDQIICIVRDYPDRTNQQLEKLMENRQDQVLSIRKIEENNAAFNSNLAVLREKLFKLTGIGHNSRKPNGAEFRKENHNVYLDIENQICHEQYTNILIDIQDESIRKISSAIDAHLRSIDGALEDLQTHLFKHVALNKAKQNEENKKVKLVGTDTEEKQAALTKIDQEIVNLSQKKAATVPSVLLCKYNELFLRKEFASINELDKRVSVWQSPILSPLFRERNKIVIELEACRTSIADIQAKNNNSGELASKQALKSNLEERKTKVSKLIDDKTINKDIFMRELLAIYGDKDFLTNANSNDETRQLNFNKDLYITSFIEYMIKGNEIEIIDGDNNSFNYDIVSQIFQGLEAKYRQMGEGPPFVVSVIGPQSTGKSTLLNMLFGSNFQTSAGRCTKGLYASIFETKYPKAKTLLVLDTEGLLSIEKANEECDKKLTLFSMACSQVMLINLNGEINSAMKKILSISLFVANQLKVFKTRPIIIFVLRNMMDLNVDKQREMIDNVKKELKEVSELSKLKLDQVLDFKEEKAFFLMLTAFNKDFVYNKTEELFQKSTTNIKFAKLSQELKERIFAEADASDPKFKSLSDWIKSASDIWKTIDLYNDMIMIESVKEISDRKELSDIITKIMELYIEPNSTKTSFRSKLELILNQEENLMNDPTYVFSNVEQRFDNEMEECKEKVKKNFEDQVKTKSYTVKLMNEYKDRLLSAITTSKTQALQKYKAIAEKRKIKNKTEAALIELQSRSEIKILQWQKVQQDTSTEKKTKIKNDIIDDFKKFMRDTKTDTVNEMDKSKKSRAQWEDFVLQQIKSAVGTIPVEKRFFSLAQLDQKSSGTTSSINIIKLIINLQDYDEQDAVLDKIPLLIQHKQKYSQISHNFAMEDTACSTENKIYKEKPSNYLTNKWTKLTSWILNKFQQEIHTAKKRKNHDPSLALRNPTVGKQNYEFSLYPQSSSIEKLYEAGISPEATILVYSMFLEMTEYLQKSIKNEINKSPEYQITCLKQNILQIEAKKTELNQKFLEEEDLQFTYTFGNELIDWLYEIIVNKMFRDEEITYRKMQQDFEKDVNKLLEDLIRRLDAAFGDAENATDMATKVFNNIQNICFSKIEIEYKSDLEQATYLNADKLVELSDKVFYETNGQFDKDGIYEYITNMIDYMKKVYSKYFDDKAGDIENAYDQKYSTLYIQQYENLISKLQQLERIFANYNWSPSHTDSHKTHFTKFFKAYLEQNIDDKLINTYLKQSLNLTYHHSNTELLEPGKLFQNIFISIYSITNPKLFLTSFKNTIQALYDNNKKNDIKFQLTDDTLKEKDKIKAGNQQKALGCIEQCPYCGCKCTEITERHDAHHSDKHRLMAFNGSFEKLKSGKKGFVFDLCNSDNTIRHSRWKENSSSQLSIRDSKLIRERMNEYSVGEGDVTITLIWFDSSDLDLHVTCPCGTELYFANKKCPTCEGYLDLDMNVCCHGDSCPRKPIRCSSTKPAENLYFRPAKNGLYKVSVDCFTGRHDNAGKSSQFEVRIQTHANNNVQTFTGCVEADTKKRHVKVGDYEHSDVSLNFLEHVKKNFHSWSNIRPINDNKWEIVLKKAWWQVAPKMSEFYGYENNTRAQFRTLQYQ